MSVDFVIEDVSLGKTLLHCRNAYVDALGVMLRPYLPSGRKWLAFQEHDSAYVDYAYWGVKEEPMTDDELPFASELEEDFQLLVKALKSFKKTSTADLDEFKNRALKIFTLDLLEFMRDHCRDNPNSRIRISLC